MTRESDEDLTRRGLYPFYTLVYTLADKNEGKEKFTTREKRYSFAALFDDAGLKVGRTYVYVIEMPKERSLSHNSPLVGRRAMRLRAAGCSSSTLCSFFRVNLQQLKGIP